MKPNLIKTVSTSFQVYQDKFGPYSLPWNAYYPIAYSEETFKTNPHLTFKWSLVQYAFDSKAVSTKNKQ